MIIFYLGQQVQNKDAYLQVLENETVFILRRKQWDEKLSQILQQAKECRQKESTSDLSEVYADFKEYPQPLLVFDQIPSDKALESAESLREAGLEEPLLCMTTPNNLNWSFSKIISDVSLEAKTISLMEKISEKIRLANRFRFNLDPNYANTYMRAAMLLKTQADYPLLEQAYKDLLALDMLF